MNQKKDISSVQINFAKRAMVLHDQVSASLITGSEKLKSGFGNGDCLLLDLQNLFFAVSDSTDRWPDASRNILQGMIKDLAGYVPKDNNEWLNFINAAYDRQEYIYRATISAVFINRQNDQHEAVIIHGGDSLILIIDVRTGQVKYQSISDMNFVGRAKSLSKVESVPLESENERIIIASDGLADLARIVNYPLEEMCINAASRYSVDEVPQQIAELFNRQEDSLKYDDIGIVVIDPFKVQLNKDLCLLMGGTMPEAEKRFYFALQESKIIDEWITLDKINATEEKYIIAGISDESS